MATLVEMPKMGYDMTEGTILRWTKAEGDAVAKGEVLGEIETGKVNIEIEAFAEGVLRKILIPEGQTVPVGTPIAVIGAADEAITLPTPAGAPSAASAPAASPGNGAGRAAASAEAPAAPDRRPAPTEAPTAADTSALAQGDGAAAGAAGPEGRLRVSPLARRMAAEHGIALAALKGSGPQGRVVRDDVLEAVAAGAAAGAPTAMPGLPTATPALPAAATREPLSAIRRTIARRLGESWSSAPHIFLTMAIDMQAALALREAVNGTLEATGGGKVSVNDLVVKAAARALRAHPRLNVSWDDGARLVHAGIHVGVAVALEDGLITVTVPDADRRGLAEIASELVDKAARARAGKLQPADMAVASTFTVSNLGMYGIEDFTAIINPPEACILAVGAAAPTPVVVDGAIVVRPIMKVTLSADHRVVDGASAAAFLVTFKQLLEQPLAMLI